MIITAKQTLGGFRRACRCSVTKFPTIETLKGIFSFPDFTSGPSKKDSVKFKNGVDYTMVNFKKSRVCVISGE